MQTFFLFFTCIYEIFVVPLRRIFEFNPIKNKKQRQKEAKR